MASATCSLTTTPASIVSPVNVSGMSGPSGSRIISPPSLLAWRASRDPSGTRIASTGSWMSASTGSSVTTQLCTMRAVTSPLILTPSFFQRAICNSALSDSTSLTPQSFANAALSRSFAESCTLTAFAEICPTFTG
ncbi:hypothetical protein D9M72_545240 [compost metagenome]